MTNKQAALIKFPGAKARKEACGQGFTVMTANESRIAWAPSAAEAWRIAAGQPVRS